MRNQRTKLRSRWRPAAFAVALLLAIGIAVMGLPGMTQGNQPPGPLPEPIPGSPSSPAVLGAPPVPGPDSGARELERRQAFARNEERQKELVRDTNKLLQLAIELKTAVDKSNKDTLSIDVIKKADEIQKLAKSVRDKMKAD